MVDLVAAASVVAAAVHGNKLGGLVSPFLLVGDYFEICLCNHGVHISCTAYNNNDSLLYFW